MTMIMMSQKRKRLRKVLVLASAAGLGNLPVTSRGYQRRLAKC